MKNQSRTGSFRVRVSVFVLIVSQISLPLMLIGQVPYNPPTATRLQPNIMVTLDSTWTGTFVVPEGSLTVILPDDIRAGDTISGTVVVEPAGQTPEEKAENRDKLADYVIVAPFKPRPADPKAGANPNVLNVGDISGIVIDANGPSTFNAGFYIQDPEPGQGPTTSEGVFVLTKPTPTPGAPVGAVSPPKPPPTPNLGLYLLPNQNSPLGAGACGRSGSLVAINESCSPISQLVFTQPRPEPVTVNPSPTFTVPAFGQTGKPVAITGPFDGNSANTQPFVNFPLSPEGGPNAAPATQGTACPVITESPRKAVIRVPPNIVGPAEITLNEGGKQTTLPFRNIGVSLSAPKTSLLKGEKTVLTVLITGLQNLTQPVPLILTSRGVITMDGGVYQPMMILPSEVRIDGTYLTTRSITGVQAGGWGATATVVTGRFNVALQDDSRPATVILWNTVSGDYRFSGPFPPVQPPAQPPPAALTGTGKTALKGCILTLTHNAPDRRVFARLDTCTNSGDATIETSKPKADFTITDRDTRQTTAIMQ